MALLGAMLLNPRVTPEVTGLVTRAEDFYSEAHAAIYQTLIDVYDRTPEADLVTIVDTLRDRGQLELVGGIPFLEKLASETPSSAAAVHYAQIVAEKAKLRRLIEASEETIHEALGAGSLGPDGAREILDRAEQRVFEIAQDDQRSDPQRLAELLTIEYERMLAQEGHGISGIRTHYADLDDLLQGLQPGEMIILAARPSMGKTALALNLAEQIALGGVPEGGEGAPTPVGVFSLEMTKSAVVQRLISARSRVASHAIRSGALSGQAKFDVQVACDALRGAPIFVDDTPGMSVLTLRARARRMVAQHDVRVIFVDYLQLLTAPGSARESRQVEVSAISRGIKALARELNVPVVCLSQLNRASEHREGNRPRMSDLRESGSIEQDADVVLLLHREDYYHVGDEEWKQNNAEKINVAEVIIAKQRNGPTGLVNLTWDSRSTRFRSHAPGYHGVDDPDWAGRAAITTRPAFAPPSKTGPVSDFRDGGGPDRTDESEPPF